MQQIATLLYPTLPVAVGIDEAETMPAGGVVVILVFCFRYSCV